MIWLSMEGGLMKFLVRNARGKIIEDAEEKRDDLIQTFQVIGHVLFISCMFVQAISLGTSTQQV